MTGHTPGPWKHDGFGAISAAGCVDTFNGPVWGTIARTELTFATDMDGRHWTCSGSQEANARLIAAAPELLAALNEIANGEGVYGAQAHEYKQIARAAITKATQGGGL